MAVFTQFAIAGRYLNAVALTPNDGVDLAQVMEVRCGAAGTVQFTPAGGQAPLTLTMAAGEWLPCQVIRVWATGTTATPLTGVY